MIPRAAEAVPDDRGVVVRPTRTAHWHLLRDGTTAASGYAVARPDRRWFVSVDAWQDDDHEPLVHAMIGDLAQDLHTRIDGADEAALELWSRFGFEPERRELEFLFSPDPERTGLADVRLPEGIALLPADGVDEVALRELDDRLRQDIPGSTGWVNDPDEFRSTTFSERFFDPDTHLVAVDDERREFAGLVRIRANGDRSRLGLVGVARAYRRRGLAQAMLARALRPVHERGVTEVMAEVDAANAAGLAVVRALGALQTGSSVVLIRRMHPSEPGLA